MPRNCILHYIGNAQKPKAP